MAEERFGMSGGIGKRGQHRLSDRDVEAFVHRAQRRQGPKKVSDGGGLYLTRTPAGTPVWRIKYRLAGKERLYAVGPITDCSLEGAREHLRTVRNQVRVGRDPVLQRKIERAAALSKAEDRFEDLATEWLKMRRLGWSNIHYVKSKRAIERDVLPRLGKLPVSEITSPMVAAAIGDIADRGARDTAAKVLQHCSGIFRLAQARGLRADDPAQPVKELLPRCKQAGRRPALLEWIDLGNILHAAELARLSPAVRMAHRLCAFTVARIGNVVAAEWSEMRLDDAIPMWVIPRRKMKAQDRRHDHKIILAPGIAQELREWRAKVGINGQVFPSPTGRKHISRESIEKVYRVTLRLGDRHTPHGWRAAFSTLARDHGFERDVVELTLDHVHDSDVARAYDRGERLQQRFGLMAWWAMELSKAQKAALPSARPATSTSDAATMA